MPTNNKPADILIIDDNESDAMLMEEAVKDTVMANSIKIVHSAAEGIKYLNQAEEYENAPRPDLILLDLKMPEMDGHDFLKIIKNDPRFLHIPIIVLTTSSDNNDIAESYRLHANCYIVKPVNFTKFKAMVAVINEFWLGIAHLPPKDR
ncbi:MAG: response regulator [Alphaproteobacteria bacterium]